ncbi:MAG: hypothetical protein ABJF10_15275 [Chthoniobacter sp.]|uniref:hypothetical protein n=1 Tax=Chthoniobacter sp. TaxID=2510640 RepID=UPI0032A4B109
MRFSLPIAALLAIVMAGCATPQEKASRQQAKAERQKLQEDTRAAERKRMLAIENREVNSERGAQILEYNLNAAFDPNKATAAAAHGFNTGKAQTKGFYSDQQVRMDTYQTRDFGTKTNQAGQRQYATGEANTKGRFLNLFASKTAKTKAAGTKEAWDANKVASSRPLADGKRPYLGPESKKLGQPLDAKELANWRNGGESVVYSDGTVEKMSTIKQLSIDDIRELLNKNK